MEARKPDWSVALEYVGPNGDNQSGKSRKFWAGYVYGCVFVRRWGKIGTAGQTMQERFATPWQAKQAALKMAESKRAKGYTNEVDIITLIGSLAEDAA